MAQFQIFISRALDHAVKWALAMAAQVAPTSPTKFIFQQRFAQHIASHKRLKRLESGSGHHGREDTQSELRAAKKLAASLSDEKLVEYKSIFMFFDREEKGMIGSYELENVLKAMGENPSKNQVQKLVDEVDVDNSGTIDFFEFLIIMVTRAPDPNEDIRQAFRLFDNDGSGQVSAAEFRKTLTTLGEQMSEEEVDEMMAVLDKDGDGNLNYEEFLQFIVHGIEENKEDYNTET